MAEVDDESGGTAVHMALREVYSPRTTPPDWVEEILGGAAAHHVDVGGVAVQVREGGGVCLVSGRIARATAMSAAELAGAVQGLYGAIAETLGHRSARHPVRFWNHIPDIHAEMGEGMDRYMAFNMGRYNAFCRWFGSEKAFGECVATASGIGCEGEDLVIHALAGERGGVAIANPRQVAPYRYSVRYGPRPPCFARATAWGKRLLIGGTASVRGEESVHVGDLEAQLGETYANLQALLAQAAVTTKRAWDAGCMRWLRVYIPREEFAERIERSVMTMFPRVEQLELVARRCAGGSCWLRLRALRWFDRAAVSVCMELIERICRHASERPQVAGDSLRG